jgi:hypothetical protein
MIRKKGQNVPEYTIVLALVLLSSMAVIFLFGETISSYFSKNSAVSVYEGAERTKAKLHSQSFDSALTGTTEVQAAVLDNSAQADSTAVSNGKLELAMTVKTPDAPVLGTTAPVENIDTTEYPIGDPITYSNYILMMNDFDSYPGGFISSPSVNVTTPKVLISSDSANPTAQRTLLDKNIAANAANYSLGMNLSLTGSSGSAGLVFRATNPGANMDGYSFEAVDSNGSKNLTFFKWVDGVKTAIASKPASDFGIDINAAQQTKPISLSVNGGDFKATINGIDFAVYDSTYNAGQVGMNFSGDAAATVNGIKMPTP